MSRHDPATRTLKRALAEIGIPRNQTRVRTDRGVTSATAHGHEHLLAEHADHLTGLGYAVVIWRHECGCIATARVTDDPRHVKGTPRLEQRTQAADPEHRCPPARPAAPRKAASPACP